MSRNVHSQMRLIYLQMFHAVFSVADGEDEVDDGGELFEQQMMTSCHGRHTLPEAGRLVVTVTSSGATLDRVNTHSL